MMVAKVIEVKSTRREAVVAIKKLLKNAVI